MIPAHDRMAIVISSVAAVGLLGSLAFVGFILGDIDSFVVSSNDALKEFEHFEKAAWKDMMFERPLQWRQKKVPVFLRRPKRVAKPKRIKRSTEGTSVRTTAKSPAAHAETFPLPRQVFSDAPYTIPESYPTRGPLSSSEFYTMSSTTEEYETTQNDEYSTTTEKTASETETTEEAYNKEKLSVVEGIKDKREDNADDEQEADGDEDTEEDEMTMMMAMDMEEYGFCEATKSPCSRPPSCPAGEPGPPGKYGIPGEDAPPGVDGKPGEDWKLGEDDQVIVLGCVKCPMGPPGAEGDPGPPGSRGTPGKNGENGLDGLPGYPGAAGPPGAPGFDGWPGDPGVPGEYGLSAVIEVCPPGPPGPPGEPGPPGAPGTNGANGDGGFPGAAGGAGIPGKHGVSGPPGEPGPPGDPGPDAPSVSVGVRHCECPHPERHEVVYQTFSPLYHTPPLIYEETTYPTSPSTYETAPSTNYRYYVRATARQAVNNYVDSYYSSRTVAPPPYTVPPPSYMGKSAVEFQSPTDFVPLDHERPDFERIHRDAPSTKKPEGMIDEQKAEKRQTAEDYGEES